MPHTLYRISFFREGVTWESMPRSYHGLALENGSILAKRASLNAHSSTYYTGLFLHIVLDRPLTVIKRCCMASSCLRISDIVLFYELRVILLAFSFINRTDLWQGHSDGLRLLQACPRSRTEPRFEWPACPMAAGQLVLRKSILSPTRPPTAAEEAAASKREMFIRSVKMNRCFRAYLGQTLLRMRRNHE